MNIILLSHSRLCCQAHFDPDSIRFQPPRARVQNLNRFNLCTLQQVNFRIQIRFKIENLTFQWER